MGFHEIMKAVRSLSPDEQALVIKNTVDILRLEPDGFNPELESLLSRRWSNHLADPSKSRPAREVISELMQRKADK
jgi:hypothetical protein